MGLIPILLSLLALMVLLSSCADVTVHEWKVLGNASNLPCKSSVIGFSGHGAETAIDVLCPNGDVYEKVFN